MSSFTPMKLNTDILYLICDHLRSSPSDLARFALVHPSWTNPAQAQLYRRIAISSPKLNHASTVRMKRLLRTAEQEKRLARGVRGVIVSTIGGAETVAAFERLLMLCTEVVDVALEGKLPPNSPFRRRSLNTDPSHAQVARTRHSHSSSTPSYVPQSTLHPSRSPLTTAPTRNTSLQAPHSRPLTLPLACRASTTSDNSTSLTSHHLQKTPGHQLTSLLSPI